MEESNNSGKNLKDFNVNIKIKLAALWASVTFCYLYGDYFELYVPQKVAGLVSGDQLLDSPAKLFLATFMLSIPSVMVFLSVALKPTLNRWLNILFGLIFTLMMVLIAVNSISPWFYFYAYMAIIESILTSLIVWYAIKWPKQ